MSDDELSELEELAEEYGFDDPEVLLRPAEPPAPHLTEADEAFLSNVSARAGHEAIVVDRAIEAHFAAAAALGVEPTLAEGDVPDPGATREAWEASGRLIRSRTRELERRARADAVRASRAKLAGGG
jgi:hypothetical protein